MPTYAVVDAFLVMVAVLLFRPHGLLGWSDGWRRPNRRFRPGSSGCRRTRVRDRSVATGEPLSFTAHSVAHRGHAIEWRTMRIADGSRFPARGTIPGRRLNHLHDALKAPMPDESQKPAPPALLPRGELRAARCNSHDPSSSGGPFVMKIKEFHCFMPSASVPSVMKRGVLSYHRAIKLAHRSVAMPEIQERRSKVRIPHGRPLHHYANFYLDARNPMLYKRRNNAIGLCVLRISTAARHIEGAVLADRNASSEYVRFLASAKPSCWIWKTSMHGTGNIRATRSLHFGTNPRNVQSSWSPIDCRQNSSRVRTW